MPSIYKPIANEAPMNSTFTSVGNNRLIRVLNVSGGNVLISTTSNGVNVGSLTIMTGTEIFIYKHLNDTMAANTSANSLLVTPVAFEEEG